MYLAYLLSLHSEFKFPKPALGFTTKPSSLVSFSRLGMVYSLSLDNCMHLSRKLQITLSSLPFTSTHQSVERPKGKMAINIEHLPQELVFNVFSRLPIRLLLNCKCVCKSWFHIITDPHFVAHYYSVCNNPTREEHLLVIRRPLSSRKKACISILSWKNFNESKGLHSYQFKVLPKISHSPVLYDDFDEEPFIDDDPFIDDEPFLKTVLKGNLYCHRDYVSFGFDPETNDYKVVVLKRFCWKEAYERESGRWIVELYSLNSNFWRKLDVAALPLSLDICSSSRVYTYANNCYHWRGYVDEKCGKKGEIILAFDMVNELFRKIKMPKTCYSFKECVAFLAPFNDSTTISVILSQWGGTAMCFDVWVMKDYWDEGSWIKQYSVGPMPGFFSLVGFYGNDRFLLLGKNENLVLYKADCDDTRDFQVYGTRGSVGATRYMESLVSLYRGNESRHQYFSCSLVPKVY